jgi:hypothetical protein
VSEATDKEMRDAVERWARARGFTEGMAPWYAMFVVDRIRISRRHSDYKHRAEVGQPLYERTETSPHAALVWALVLEARPLRDGSDCNRCRGRGTRGEWAQRRHRLDRGTADQDARSFEVSRGFLLSEGFVVKTHGSDWLVASRTVQCPDCEGTGLADLTDAYAQYVLDAQPQLQGNPAVYVWVEPGDKASIEALHMLADLLQDWVCSKCDRPSEPRGSCRHCGGSLAPSPHQALGLHLAHLLAGKRERTADAVELLLLAPYKFTSSVWSPTGVQRATAGAPGERPAIHAALNRQDSSPPFQGEMTASARCPACALGRAHTQALHNAGLDPAAGPP